MRILERNSLIIVVVVALFTLFFGIGSIPLLDPDEPVYAETAREMIEWGDYLSPRIYNQFWFDKPPLYYWLVVIMQKIFGFTEFAARFPAALMGALTTIMVYVAGAKFLSERAGFWASLALTSCVQFFYMSKGAVTDTTLLFFMTGALLAFINKNYWLMYVAMAFATLTKGPIGIVFPGIIIFLYLFAMGKLDEIFRMHVIRGLLIYVLICSPWYYGMYAVHGQKFIDGFFLFNNVTRFTTAEHAARVSFWYYFPVIILGLFPWTGLYFLSVKSCICESRSDEMRKLIFLHIWSGFVFIFFTICQTKLVSYILPMFPAMALSIGWYIAWMENRVRYNKILWSWIYSSGVTYLLLTIIWLVVAKFLPEVSASIFILAASTFILGAAACFTIYTYKDVQMASFIHVGTGILTMIVAFGFVLPAISDRFSVKTLSAVYLAECRNDLPIHVDKFLRPGFKYYSRYAGEDMVPRTDDFSNALKNGEHKYFLLRGTMLRRFEKSDKLPQDVRVLKEKDDIYLLEQGN